MQAIQLIACALLLAPTLGARADTKRPNVLFLAVDDLNTWLLGDPNRYTGRVVAPNIQQLARSGVLFARAYAASPKCSPSRTALLSGVGPWRSGVYENGLDTAASTALRSATSLPEFFRQAGYDTAGAGKIGHGWGSAAAMWDQWMNHRRDPAPPGAPLNGWAATRTGRATEKDWGLTHLAEAEMNDAKYADFAIRQLQQAHTAPFFIACGLFHPHFPWYVPQRYLDMFPLDDLVVPAIKEDDLEDVPPAGQALANRGLDASIREHHQVKDAIRGYLASTAFADAQIGRVLDALARSPYRDNTIVVLWSDHGFHLGEKRHWAKSTLWEEATHCLLMFRVPGVTQPRRRCERFVSLLDIYRTLAELCDLEPPATVEGRSLLPLLRNPDAPWRSTAVTAYYDRYITVRTERFRYIRYGAGQEELYDCQQDPHEWTNRIHAADYAAPLQTLRRMVPAQTQMAPRVPSK